MELGFEARDHSQQIHAEELARLNMALCQEAPEEDPAVF